MCQLPLDVTFDLRTSSFKPYMKPGNTLQYVHRQSNHPPAVLKAIPDAINNRLSNYNYKLKYNLQLQVKIQSPACKDKTH